MLPEDNPTQQPPVAARRFGKNYGTVLYAWVSRPSESPSPFAGKPYCPEHYREQLRSSAVGGKKIVCVETCLAGMTETEILVTHRRAYWGKCPICCAIGQLVIEKQELRQMQLEVDAQQNVLDAPICYVCKIPTRVTTMVPESKRPEWRCPRCGRRFTLL